VASHASLFGNCTGRKCFGIRIPCSIARLLFASAHQQKVLWHSEPLHRQKVLNALASASVSVSASAMASALELNNASASASLSLSPSPPPTPSHHTHHTHHNHHHHHHHHHQSITTAAQQCFVIHRTMKTLWRQAALLWIRVHTAELVPHRRLSMYETQVYYCCQKCIKTGT
jgi:hypothetical protein